MKEKSEEKETPFFARFLEGQDNQEMTMGTTLKYPSDRDEE